MTGMMKRVLIIATLAAGSAQAQSAAEAFLSVCGNPRSSVAEAARTCRLALDTGRLTPEQEAAAALNLGAAMLETDNPEAAQSAYERALGVRPNWAPALAGRAAARAARGDAGGAAVDWNRAVDAAPDDPRIRGDRGAFRLSQGNAAGALEDIQRARAVKPGDPVLLFNLGLALGELQRDAEAEAAFSAVIAADPADAAAWLNRARVRLGRDRAAALADLNEAVARAGGWTQPLVERGALLDAMGRRAEADADFLRAFELGHRSEALNERVANR